ncbi:hypothetical protein D358_01296, partial [Enterococcus faecalis RP2S-4]
QFEIIKVTKTISMWLGCRVELSRFLLCVSNDNYLRELNNSVKNDTKKKEP